MNGEDPVHPDLSRRSAHLRARLFLILRLQRRFHVEALLGDRYADCVRDHFMLDYAIYIFALTMRHRWEGVLFSAQFRQS